jgi:hypothetical protein
MKNVHSFEVQHTGTLSAESKVHSPSPQLNQRQRKVGVAVSALLGSIGLTSGCAQQEPAQAAPIAACQLDHTRHERIVNEYQHARGGLPPDLQFPSRKEEARTETPQDNTELMLSIDDTKSFLIIKRELLGRNMDYLDEMLEKVFERTSMGRNFTPEEMAQIQSEIQQIRESYDDPSASESTSTATSPEKPQVR